MCKLFRVVSIVICFGLSPVAFGQPQMDAEADNVLKALNTYMSGLDSLLIQADVAEDSVYGDVRFRRYCAAVVYGE